MQTAKINKYSFFIVTGVAICAFLIAAVSFYFAFRKCDFEMQVNDSLTYSLTTKRIEIVDGKKNKNSTHTQTQVIQLCCVETPNIENIGNNDENKVLLISKEENDADLLQINKQGEVSLYSFEDNKVLDGIGRSIGFFDFNLLPLPKDYSQSWDVNLYYAWLPEKYRTVEAKVKRKKNGSNPEFELKMKPIEWIEEGQIEHYRRISKFVCSYRYNSFQKAVDQADLSFILSIEGKKQPKEYEISLNLNLDNKEQITNKTKQLVADMMISKTKSNKNKIINVQKILQNLQNKKGYILQVLSVNESKIEAVKKEARKLKDKGFRVKIKKKNKMLVLYLGPYKTKNEEIMQKALKLYPSNKPFWKSQK